MKKTSLILTLCILLPLTLFGQESKIHTWSLQGNYDAMAATDNVYGSDVYCVSIIYEENIKPKLIIGGGLGLGSSNAVVYDWAVGVIEDDDLREKTPIAKIFGKVKYKFKNTPSGMFLNCDFGYILGSVEDYYGVDYNPLGINISPSVGASLFLNSNSSLFFGAGLSFQSIKYQDPLIKWDSYLEKYTNDGVEVVSEFFPGFQLYAGITF